MSFRKRNVGISSSGPRESITKSQVPPLPGVRPSPLDGRPTTSTGTATLDNLLAGHAGLALGASLLIEESGATDYAGALLKLYAAEGLVQGQHVHVVGLPEQWARNLPGLARQGDKESQAGDVKDKMKIAWRYEGLGRFGEESKTRGGRSIPVHSIVLALNFNHCCRQLL
jgi:elongator complex protein 4